GEPHYSWGHLGAIFASGNPFRIAIIASMPFISGICMSMRIDVRTEVKLAYCFQGIRCFICDCYARSIRIESCRHSRVSRFQNRDSADVSGLGVIGVQLAALDAGEVRRYKQRLEVIWHPAVWRTGHRSECVQFPVAPGFLPALSRPLTAVFAHG